MLTDLSIDWNGLPVTDIYPNKLLDLFSAKPVNVHGRYTKAASGTIKLKGKIAGQPYERDIAVNLPESETANDVLATLWARQRIDDISSDQLKAATTEKGAELDKQITNIGLEFRLLTQFTSFVAVEDRVVNQNGKPVTVQVPVERPEGTEKGELSAVYRKWLSNDVAYILDGSDSNTVSTRQISNLPVNGRGSVNMSVVTVTAGAGGVLQTESSQISTTVDVAATQRGNTGGGGGGGRSKPRKVKGNRAGSGSGSGVGYGSGNGTGPDAKDSPAPPPAKPKSPPTAEMIRDTRLKEKLHSWLYAIVVRLAKGDAKPTPNEAMFVRDGKADIRIELTVRSTEVIEKLKAAGFEIVEEKGKASVIGRIALDKLAALVDIQEVKLILPTN